MVDRKYSKDKASKIYHQVGGVSSEITPQAPNFLGFRPTGDEKSLKQAIRALSGILASDPREPRFSQGPTRAGGEQIQPWRTS